MPRIGDDLRVNSCAMSTTHALRPGLVSITFRALAPERVVEVARDAGLATIEWGGDVHCPPGDATRAARVRDLTESAGLTTFAYGSYYRAGAAADPFDAVLDVARALAAPSIRVWAGTLASADATADDRARVADDLKSICDAAGPHGTAIALEYHRGTLTDDPHATIDLIRAVGRPNLRTYWQPRHGLSVDENLADIDLLAPWLGDVHAFHWWPTAATRRPLADGADRWPAYVDRLSDRPRTIALEFVKDDRVEQMAADATTLLTLIR